MAVAKNLAETVPRAGLADRFVVFDNASTFDDHLACLPPGSLICRAERNVGYWAAIKWVLETRVELFARPFDYLYIVESDLVHWDLRQLAACEAFLDAEQRASGVRTQEFSVRWRWRYDKRLKFLPFHVTRSEVALRNAITGERAWFSPVKEHDGIYLSNLHPKLPALNRISALDTVFAALATKDAFVEADFFRLMMGCHPLIGVFDGGLYHSLISGSEGGTVVTGSYSANQALAKFGYHPTRSARISPQVDSVLVARTG